MTAKYRVITNLGWSIAQQNLLGSEGSQSTKSQHKRQGLSKKKSHKDRRQLTATRRSLGTAPGHR